MVEAIAGLEVLADRFDGFLIDQFGVLLDGAGAYDGAQAALSRLAAAGKVIVILSNSGKRSEPNMRRLDHLGFPRDSYRLVLSSGEVAYRILSESIGRDLPRGSGIFLHARDADTSAIDGLPLRLVERPAAAARILLTASRGDECTLEDYEHLLRPAAERAVPCICSNPDLVMLTPAGPTFGAGAIADLYERMGGPVTRIGKPFAEIYRAALDELAPLEADRIVCLGDSLEHDIAGGGGAGFATVLLRTGIQADRTDDRLNRAFAETGQRPEFILPRFAFSD